MGTFNTASTHLTTRIEDTSGTTGVTNLCLFIAPTDGFLRRLDTVISGTLTTTDCVLTIYINGTTTGVTQTLLVAGSAAGVAVGTDFNKEVRQNDIIKVAVTTAEATGRSAHLTLTMVRR